MVGECILGIGGWGQNWGIYSIHFFVHRLGSCFCYKNCIEKGQPGKRVYQRVWPKGDIYSIHLFVHRPCSPFCYKICIERGQPGKRVWSKGGIYSIHLFVHRLGSPFLL